MELVEGQDLRSRIRHSPVPLDELAVIGAGLADALAYVHSLGIIHRDVKPANVLLVQVRPGEPVRPKLTDFGIARIIDGTRLTATGTMVGTAAYLSPEQARGADIGPASDIYSLGLVLLECIKGSVEYPGSAVESAVARLHRAPVIPGDVPAEWAELIRAMTALDPLDRPAAAELEAALRQALISPKSLPGALVEGRTRVLPAPPARPPRSAAAVPDATAHATAQRTAETTAQKTAVDGLSAAVHGREPSASRPASRPHALTRGQAPQRESARGRTGFRHARRRGRIAVALVVLALLGAAVFVVSFAIPEPETVVPSYPAVTGDVGEHLKQLQKDVEP
jgi:serine/threonine protein kinase